MKAIVYRIIANRPRQYVRRIVNNRTVLWTNDAAQAERMTANDAATIAACLRSRSAGEPYHRNVMPSEPAGEYGALEA